MIEKSIRYPAFSKEVNDRIIDITVSLQDAMLQMDSLDCKLLLVFDHQKFRSIISIGDIQRAIINGRSLTSPIEAALRTNIRIARITDNKEELIQQMKSYRMEFMPVVDDDNNLLKVIFWHEIIGKDDELLSENINCPVVIMAGGKGTRLKPLTNIIPKPLIPIGEKPFIEWIIDSFCAHGAKDFFISVNYKKEMIQNYFSQIANRQYHIEYFEEASPLGTAGSLHLLQGKLNSTFFVTNCDILVRDNYFEMLKYHRANNNELTAVAVIKSVKLPYGTFDIEAGGLIKDIKEKPEMNFFINAGMYILEPSLIDEIPTNKFFHITELIEKLILQKRRVGVFPVSPGSWLDIGEWSEYNRTSHKLGFEGFNL
jgi:dTDP-glucose pyrophosphorylase